MLSHRDTNKRVDMVVPERPQGEQGLLETLLGLETELLIGPGRYDRVFLSRTLAPDFVELDARGNKTSRDDAISWLLRVDPDTQWEIQDFSVQQVSDRVAISHFSANKLGAPAGRKTRHAGIWKLASDHWQLAYHQGTYAA